LPKSVRIYRGVGEGEESVSVITGDFEELLFKTIKKFTGDEIGHPEIGSCITPVAEITGLIMQPIDDDRLLKYEEAIEVDPETEKINDVIAQRGLRLIKESAEERLIKADEEEDEEVEERIVFAPVLEPNDGEDGAPLKPDKQAEIYSTETIRKTAHYWAEHGGVVGLMHRFDISPNVSVLETYLAPVTFKFEHDSAEYEVRKGTWLLCLRIHNDEMWKVIKDGELGAFSVGGTKITREEEVSVAS
jgi:hypothetical protein